MAAPFLGSLGGRGVRAQLVAPPRRLVLMFTHFGFITTRFFPVRSHGRLTADDLRGTTLEPLTPFVDKLLLPRGIRSMNEWTFSMSRGQGNDPHLQAVASLLTCQPVTPNADSTAITDIDAKFNAKALGPSLDHVMAKQLSPGRVPLFMRLANFSATPPTAISYSGRETIHTGYGTPAQLYASLTGLFGGGPMNPDTYRVARGKSVLDIVKDDLATLERVDMSRSDRRKLEAWKELLGRTGGTITTSQCTSDGAALLGATEANVRAATGKLTDKVDGTLDVADVYSSLAVLAAVCNANPVIVLKYPAGYTYTGLGATSDHDTLAHRVGSSATYGTCAAGVIDTLHAIDAYHAKKFAHLVSLLNGVDEGDGKVLDNTAAVWLSEFSDGAARNHNNLPIVQVGSAGGYFKTGSAVNVEDGSATLTRGSSEAVCADGTPNVIDATTPSTGTDPALANAPINKYYCNLMNALGVKAGADGFPLEGGSAPVTRFGMYDKTEDFIGGGSNPATIHDPGEFSALRA